mgnify:CR=1 FL=1
MKIIIEIKRTFHIRSKYFVTREELLLSVLVIYGLCYKKQTLRRDIRRGESSPAAKELCSYLRYPPLNAIFYQITIALPVLRDKSRTTSNEMSLNRINTTTWRSLLTMTRKLRSGFVRQTYLWKKVGLWEPERIREGIMDKKDKYQSNRIYPVAITCTWHFCKFMSNKYNIGLAKNKKQRDLFA